MFSGSTIETGRYLKTNLATSMAKSVEYGFLVFVVAASVAWFNESTEVAIVCFKGSVFVSCGSYMEYVGNREAPAIAGLISPSDCATEKHPTSLPVP